MTNEPGEPEGLSGLLSELVDGGLTPLRAERLRALLRDDPEAQDQYLRFMRLHAQLHLDYEGGSGRADMPGGSSMPVKSPSALPPVWPGEEIGSESIGVAGAGVLPGRSWLASAAVGWTLAALFAVGAIAALRWPGPRKGPAPGLEPATVASRPAAKVDAADGVAVVVRAEGVRWEMDGGRVPKRGDVLPKGRLRVREGRAMFSMLSGVAVTVEGPAEVELLSIERIACHRGRLRARVPEGAEGFVVTGPGTAVVDMGTEFGVNIRPDGKSRGRVFEGEVEAAVLASSGAMRHSRIVREASGAFEIDPESGRIGPLAAPEAEDFVAPLSPARELLAPAPGYRAAILASRPRCYWRFESEAEGAIPNEVPDEPPLRATGPVRLAESGPGNRCAVFDAGQALQYLQMDGLWKPDRSGYAIELWFLPESIGIQSLASLVAPKDTMNHLSLIEMTSSDRTSLFRPASIRFLYRWPTGRGGGDNLFSDDVYIPYRWHHVVAQVAGERMELYTDGKVQASQAIGPAA